LILKISTKQKFSTKIKKRSQQQNDIRYYMHKNNKLRTQFYDIDAWLLHPGYYILNDAFLEKTKERNFKYSLVN